MCKPPAPKRALLALLVVALVPIPAPARALVLLLVMPGTRSLELCRPGGILAQERDLQVSAARRQPTLVAAMTITGCVARTARYLMRRGKGNSSMKL